MPEIQSMYVPLLLVACYTLKGLSAQLRRWANSSNVLVGIRHYPHLPNFHQDDIDISVENGALVIQAERHEKEEDKKKKYVVRESSSSFYRRIQLPERAEADKIDAHLDDGVLKVVVPLAPLPEPKKITVKSKAGKK